MIPLGKRHVALGVLSLVLVGAAALIGIIHDGARPHDGSLWWRTAVSLGIVVLVVGAGYYVDLVQKRDERRIVATGARWLGRIVTRYNYDVTLGSKSSLTVVWPCNGRPYEAVFFISYREWLQPGVQVELIADPAEVGHILLRVGRDEYISSQDFPIS